MEWVAHSLDDLPFVAKSFLESLGHHKIVVFDGQMGAGKTTFITAVFLAMGITDPDGSPTYSIVNSYHSDYYGSVFHYDVYRLKSIEEALGIGMEETLWVTIEVNEIGERIIRVTENK